MSLVSPFGIRVAAAAFALAVTGAVSACGHAPAQVSTRPAIVMPDLSGSAPVGTQTVRVITRRHDRSFVSDRRELMIQLWYPAARVSGPLAPYMTHTTASAFERFAHLPPGLVARIRTHAHTAAPIAAGRHRVLLYSPGSSEMRSDATALVEDLASAGYVVVAIDHTHEAQLVDFGGRLIRGRFRDTGPASNRRALRVRITDVHDVLDFLARRRGRLAAHLDLAHTGMLGFSLGGATAAAAMRVDPRIRVGVDLDGSLYGPVVRAGLTRPLMLMLEPRVVAHDPTIKPFFARLRGPHLVVELAGSAHQTYEDLVWVKPQLAKIDPAVARTIGDVGRIPAARAISIESAYVTAFFDRYLGGRHERLLRFSSPAYPEATLVRDPRDPAWRGRPGRRRPAPAFEPARRHIRRGREAHRSRAHGHKPNAGQGFLAG